jgi:hypothetical protein
MYRYYIIEIGGDDMTDGSYPSDDEVSSLMRVDEVVFGDKSSKQRAQDIFARNAPDAAMTIVSIAKSSSNDNTRLRAAQYVVDRTMGPLSSTIPPKDGEVDELTKAMLDFHDAVQADARAQQGGPN